MKFKDTTGAEKSDVAAMMAYFGRAEGQSLSGFMDEVKKLDPASRDELAVGAARALGWTVA